MVLVSGSKVVVVFLGFRMFPWTFIPGKFPFNVWLLSYHQRVFLLTKEDKYLNLDILLYSCLVR